MIYLMGIPSKKRGRPRKLDPILLALGECPEKWNQYLWDTYGLPQDPQPRDEVSETAFVDDDGVLSPLEDVAGGQIKPYEEPPKGLGKVRAEDSGPECVPTEQWKRSLAFFRVIVCIWGSKRNLSEQERTELLKYVDDHRPSEPLPIFPESLGTPDELLQRWKCRELEVSLTAKNRATQIFEIWSTGLREHLDAQPDDDPDDALDDPPGHWEGRVWHPASAKVEGS